MFGLNEPIRAVADRYAAQGHAALVPNLFWRSEIPGAISYDDPQHAAAWARLKALDLDVVVGRHARRGGLAARAAVWQRQGRGDRLLRRRAVCVSCRGALRRRRGGVALRSRRLAASSARSATRRARCNCITGLKDQHIPREEIDAVAAGVRGTRMSRCSFIRRPGTPSPIRCGRPTIAAAASSPTSGSPRCWRLFEPPRNRSMWAVAVSTAFMSSGENVRLKKPWPAPG